MYIDLTGLENFKYKNSKNAYAVVENGIMRIVGAISYEKLMFCACYHKYGLVCAYCGESLTKDTKTIDHKFPKVYGGVSILDNLLPACPKCNEEKSSLFEDEYRTLCKIEDKQDKKRYRFKCIGKHEEEVAKRGFCIPEEWIEKETQVILADFIFSEDYKKSNKYLQIKEFFFKYGKMPKPIIISANNRLLDGFNLLMLAKNEAINPIPVIKLENVIVE